MPLTLSSLGSSSALPTKETYFTAHVLNVRGRLFLLDCGEGTQFRLRQMGISIGALEHIFVTHTHGDHIFGLFGLLSTMRMLERTKPIHLYGPADLGPILDFYKARFGTPCPYELFFHPVGGTAPAVVLETAEATVTSLPLEHVSVPAYGYLFTETTVRRSLPRRVAYCTDTGPVPALADWIRGVDLLFHEATFLQDRVAAARKYGHSTAQDAAQLAVEAKVGTLLLGHFSARYEDPHAFLAEARPIFPNTFLSLEGTVFEVPRVYQESNPFHYE